MLNINYLYNLHRKFDHDSRGFADENQSKEKVKKKKKKKKSKAKENGEAINSDTPLLSVEENNTSSVGIESKNSEAKTSHVRTLQNGLIVEELELGKPDGKVAVSGKRVTSLSLSLSVFAVVNPMKIIFPNIRYY